MENVQAFFEEIYQNFNDRKIEDIIVKTADDVRWANGMEGGYVYGHKGMREYWLRQFTMIKPTVTPVEFSIESDMVQVKVHQHVTDLKDSVLVDEYVQHTFHMNGDKITAFEIGEKEFFL